jgi:NADPH:quinone reductase-like Zn-dependent oxidoreductase
MKAIVFDKIGSPADVLQLREVPLPEIGDDDVLVRMVAASVNPGDVAAQFVNPITAWDLLREAAVQPGDWLALTAGNSAVSTMVLNFAKLKKVNVISIVRTAHEQLNLKEWGAAEVVELSKLPKGLAEEIAEITDQNGVNAVIDCVGGPIASELIRSLSNGGQFLIYGGFSSEKFQLHSFDLLMKGARIKPYIYRYFFHPPEANDRAVLNEIAETWPTGF